MFAKSNNHQNILTLRDYQITPDVKFDFFSYDEQKNQFTAYMLVDNRQRFDALAKQFDCKNRINNFTDIFYLIVSDPNLVAEFKPLLEYMSKDDDLKNIGLLTFINNRLDEVFKPQPNDDYWFLNYVKPSEVQKFVQACKSNPPQEFMTVHHQPTCPQNPKVTTPNYDISNISIDPRSYSVATDAILEEIDDIVLAKEPFEDAMNEYANQLNNTQGIFENFDNNGIDASQDPNELLYSPQVDDYQNYIEDQATKIFDVNPQEQLHQNSEYYRKLEEIIERLKKHPLFQNKK